MVDLTAEQRQLAKIVHDYSCRFPLTENGDAQLLQGCYDYMEVFKRVMDSASKVQMDYICLNTLDIFALHNGWKGWFRALPMESLRCRKITKNYGPEISAVPA